MSRGDRLTLAEPVSADGVYRLHRVAVEVVQSRRDEVVIRTSGAGPFLFCLTPIREFSEGMEVRARQ